MTSMSQPLWSVMLKLYATTPPGVKDGNTDSSQASSDGYSGSGGGGGRQAAHKPPGATPNLRIPHFAQSFPLAQGTQRPAFASAVASRIGLLHLLQATLAMAHGVVA